MDKNWIHEKDTAKLNNFTNIAVFLIILWELFSLYLILHFSFEAESKHEDWDILILTFSAAFVVCQKEVSSYC